LEEEARRFVAAQPVARGIAALLQDWATDPARRINWSRCQAALRGEEPAPSLLELPSDASRSLALWWDSLARHWAERSELRRQPSALGVLARCIIDSDLQAVDWNYLVVREE
jgi:hypothetical protein